MKPLLREVVAFTTPDLIRVDACNGPACVHIRPDGPFPAPDHRIPVAVQTPAPL
jgi:hypothetical protein